jgi:hypothetical protein
MIVNLLGRTVSLYSNNHFITLLAEMPKAEIIYSTLDTMDISGYTVNIKEIKEIKLPEPQDGIYLLVDKTIAFSLHRDDLLYLGKPLLYNDRGEPICAFLLEKC